MVAGAVAAYLVDGIAPSAATKCRYKTGKCTNSRSSKRNGQPHQLCLYHREKANKIQRKFDRQKRQVARVKKTSAADASVKTEASAAAAAAGSNVLDLDLSSAFALSSPFGACGLLASPSSASASSSFATLAARDVDLYSDSESSRFSSDSDSSRLSTDSESSAILEQVWQDLPRSAMDMLHGGGLGSPMPAPPTGCHQSYLSSDELDFLCSAILE